MNLRLGCGVVFLAAACAAPQQNPSGDSREMFKEADSYERFMGRWSRLVAPKLIAFSGVGEQQAVLDVGSGTGALSEAILTSTQGTTVVGVDPSAPYVEIARSRTHDARVKYEVGDAQQLQLPSATFDRTVALLVMNFIPDAGKALDEMVRVTKPGGGVAAAVWDYGGEMGMLRMFWDEAVALDPAVEPRHERNMKLSHQGELSGLWRGHGLTAVEESPLEVTLHFASFDDYWGPFLLGQGPAGGYVAKLSPEARTRLAEALKKRVLQGGTDQPFDLKARVWAVKGTVPTAH